jgi:hypothetical protein
MKSIKVQILEFIQENPGCDSVDITANFSKKTMPILIMGTLGELIKENKVERYSIGSKYGYRAILSEKKTCVNFESNLCQLGLNGEDCPFVHNDGNLICG